SLSGIAKPCSTLLQLGLVALGMPQPGLVFCVLRHRAQFGIDLHSPRSASYCKPTLSPEIAIQRLFPALRQLRTKSRNGARAVRLKPNRMPTSLHARQRESARNSLAPTKELLRSFQDVVELQPIYTELADYRYSHQRGPDIDPSPRLVAHIFQEGKH